MSEKNPFFGATFAERKAIREKSDKGEGSEVKQVDEASAEVEDKAVRPAETKSRRKKS